MKEYKLLKNIDLEEYRLIGSIIKLIEYYTLGNGQRVPTERLVAHWYLEEVKEEVPEWIESAYNYWADSWYKDRFTFRKAILDNMPKQEQQKITMQELKNCFRWLLFPDICLEELGVRDMLDTKWLLE